MDFRFSEEQQKFREEIREFCRREMTVEFLKEVLQSVEGDHFPWFYRKLAERGWIGLQWPKEYGGQGHTYIDMAIFTEEMNYYFAPLGRYIGSVGFVGESILAFGSKEQKRWFLPRIARGEILTCWCLTEPNAGSDSASIQMRAIEKNDEYILNGEKIFISGAHESNYAMVSARTDLTAPKHKGISVFLVPLPCSGISLSSIQMVGDKRLNEVFFDNVRVPREAMLGDKNMGFQNITRYTLNFERANVGHLGLLRRLIDDLTPYVRSASSAAEIFRHQLAEIKAEVTAVRWMAYRNAWMFDKGFITTKEPSMKKVLLSDLLLRVANLGIDILGRRGIIMGTDAPLMGLVEHTYREAAMHLVSAGSAEIQRNIIAQRGLGLPKNQ